jgi:hypothetical protein
MWRDPDRYEKADPVAMALTALEEKIDKLRQQFDRQTEELETLFHNLLKNHEIK